MKKTVVCLLSCFMLLCCNVFANESLVSYSDVIDDIIANGGVYNYDKNNGRWTGLIYGELIDFDDNGDEEMLVVYRDINDDTFSVGTVAVYGNNNGIAEKLYEEKIGEFLGQTDIGYYIAIKEMNGRKYLCFDRFRENIYDDKAIETISIFSMLDGKSEIIDYYGEVSPQWDTYTFDYTLCKRNEDVISESEYSDEINSYRNNSKRIELVYGMKESEMYGMFYPTENGLEIFVNTIKSNYDKTYNAKEEKYPTTDTVCNLYYGVICNNTSMFSEYSIYDMEKDGIPELFLKTGDCEANYEYVVYTVTDNTLKQIGKFNGFHSTLFSYQGNGILSHIGYMGFETVSLVAFENGEFTQTTEFESDDSYDEASGLYRYYSEMGKYFEGSEQIRVIYNDKSYNTLADEIEKYLVCDTDIKVLLNDKKISFDQAPVLLNNRTLVPMRKIFEELGAEVVWKQEENSAVATKGNTTITIKINSNIILINDKITETDVAPMLLGGRTLVPVRAISDSFGVIVGWDGDTQTVSLSTN